MKLSIESTSEIVAIEGIPCRKWIINQINGKDPSIESYIFSRLIMVPQTLMIEDEHIMSLTGPKPPNKGDLRDHVPELADTFGA